MSERRKKNPRMQRQREGMKCMDNFKEKITEGQQAACYGTVKRQLSSIQVENPVALPQNILSVLIFGISTETRLHFFFPKLHFKSLSVIPMSYTVFQRKEGILRERLTLA